MLLTFLRRTVKSEFQWVMVTCALLTPMFKTPACVYMFVRVVVLAHLLDHDLLKFAKFRSESTVKRLTGKSPWSCVKVTDATAKATWLSWFQCRVAFVVPFVLH